MSRAPRLIVGVGLLIAGAVMLLYASSFMPDAKASSEPHLVAVGVGLLLAVGILPLGIGATLVSHAFDRRDPWRFLGPAVALGVCLVPLVAAIPTLVAVCQRAGGACG